MIATEIVKLANDYANSDITEIQQNAGWQPNDVFPTFEQDMKALTGWVPNDEWCAAQAILIWKKAYAGDTVMLAIINHLVSLNSQAMANNFHKDPSWPTSVNTPKLGAMVVWALGDSATTGHTGIVVALTDNGFVSCEGNTTSLTKTNPDPNASERDGWTTALHTHVLGQPHSTLNLNLDRFIYCLESYSPLIISE